ncbi:uncharacterized protein LOC131383248 [Hylobates moloch]|uniref:uncharacterized protein LOC131383248 n=1 Tax=Hylobates moloch TaxID=81572 RepID=UPI0026751EFB|nr:uncharacterized protein LOC131383248 [Hylobates moloch]
MCLCPEFLACDNEPQGVHRRQHSHFTNRDSSCHMNWRGTGALQEPWLSKGSNLGKDPKCGIYRHSHNGKGSQLPHTQGSTKPVLQKEPCPLSAPVSLWEALGSPAVSTGWPCNCSPPSLVFSKEEHHRVTQNPPTL